METAAERPSQGSVYVRDYIYSAFQSKRTTRRIGHFIPRASFDSKTGSVKIAIVFSTFPNMVDSTDQRPISVGIEIAHNALHAAVLGGDDVVTLTRTVYMGDDGGSVVTKLIELVESLRQDFTALDRCGIAVPGLIDRVSGRVAFSANIPHHSEVDLVSELKAATGLNVVIENDANAAAIGEYEIGAGRGSKNVFYATLGEGVGGAFIFDGTIWRGAAGFAGEFGYVPINSEGTRLEDVASAANIIRRTRSRFHQDNTSSLNKLSEEAITLEDIIAAAGKDDDFAAMMLVRTGNYVGTAIASVINLLNIEKIVIGGEIMQARRLVLEAIIGRARELSFEPSFNSTSIVVGELGINAASIGAALISRNGN
ncbi:MAG: ROK family protein [Pyrinomonadaceae bacterium]